MTPIRSIRKALRHNAAGLHITHYVLRSTIRATLASCLIVGFAACSCISAADIDESKLPPPVAKKIEFDRDIRPIFEKICFRCHGTEKPKSKFRLDNKTDALKGGENGVDIFPGQSAKSPLIHYVTRIVPDMEMPPPGKGDPLTPEQIGLLRAWIDQGPEWTAAEIASVPTILYTLAPTIRWITVSGNASKFREHYWMRDGWAGGAEDFRMEGKMPAGQKLSIDGHAVTDDYRVQLTLDKPDIGFARFGFEQYRKYFDDTGGYYQGFTSRSYDLDRALHLDIGRAWTEFGLTLPTWPRMVLGYEYQFKRGDKSLLQWGTILEGTTNRAIFPAAKHIDERVHVIKFDLDHEIRGFRIENNFRGEFADLTTRRRTDLFKRSGPSPPIAEEVVREEENHFQAANAIRLEKQVTSWWFASGGYLYSHLGADASLDRNNLFAGIPGEPEHWNIVLDQDSHFFNLNGLFGPWEGLTLSTGVQNEWTRRHGFGRQDLEPFDPTLPPSATPTVRNNFDRIGVQEVFALRYTMVPFTVLFAEARWRQEAIGQTEEAINANDFLRATDASTDLKEFRAGFNTSPWERISFNASYRRYHNQSDYDHELDQISRAQTNKNEGYSAFIRARNITTDQVEAKLVFKPARWLKTSLTYKLVATDYHTTTDPVPLGTPGGQVFAGNYDAHVGSLNATLTPLARFYFSGTFSYQNARTTTDRNGNPSVATYQGDVFSVLASATYIVDEATEVYANYNFSRADFGQNNGASGLPLGIDYDLHGVQMGFRRKFKKSATTNLQYAFYKYDEPSSGHVNDYTAHGIFGTVNIRLP
ncbi:MAG: hypothetical protein DME26_07105 [Verrucomicrobia bacterium]|nr:MAG: hypothetical protein DME26_07105 [Verrucomicrobiota bacterium]